MESPEFLILAMNVLIISIAYGLFYPQIAGNRFRKISAYDSLITILILVLVGSQYWGSGYEFDLLVTKVNWFWFTFWSFSVVEIPVMLWYFKKHGIDIYSDKR
jgi:hypothetical protein